MLLLLGKDTWSAIPRIHRADLGAVFARHQARGLCSGCYERAKKAGALVECETRHVRAEWRAEDYAVIRAELPGDSAHARLRAAGKRFKCHPNTVRRALDRSGVAP